MRMSNAFPSAFLKAADLMQSPGQSVTVSINGCQLEKVGEGELPVVRFAGKDAGLVLNKTNSNVMVDAFGDDTDGWLGRVMEVYATKVQYKGDMVDGLRVRIPQQNEQKAAAEPQSVLNVDEDVPF